MAAPDLDARLRHGGARIVSLSLTPKQAALLGYIKAAIAKDGIAPSFEEMTAHLGDCSKSSISRLLDALEERGHIRRARRTHRAIELIESSDPFDAARHALARVGAPATSSNLDRVAGALAACLGSAA